MLSPQALKTHTFATLIQLCLNGSYQRPLVVELENLHWIDPTSEELLEALIEQIVGVPILLLLTARPGYRPAWLDKSYATQLALSRLTSRDSRRVVQSVLQGKEIPDAVVRQIMAKADGNPFFLEELTRTVMEQGASHLSLTVPETIQAVLAARIDRLAPEDKRLLQAASVIGKDVTLPLLQTLADVPEESLRRSLGHLQAAEFLYEVRPFPVPAYTFKHALTQEVVYQSLLQSTRRQYHQRVAQVLTTQFPEIVEAEPELLAHHYTEATLSAQAVRYWQLAGQRAVQQSAHIEAIGHLMQGLELLATLPDSAERMQQELSLQIALGPALSSTKGFAALEVERVYGRAWELSRQVGETPQRIQALRGLCGFYFLRAEHQTTHELGEQLLTMAQSVDDPAFLLEAHRVLGMTLYYRGELTAAREHLEQGIALYDPRRHYAHAFLYGLDPGVSCRSYVALTLHLLGYPEQALQRSHEALALAQQLSHPYSQAVALLLAAGLYHFRHEERTALKQAEAAMPFATEQGFVQWLAVGSIIRGWALAMQGYGMEGIAQMQQGLADWRATGAELARPLYTALLAEAYKNVADPAAGLRVLDEALALVHTNGECLLEAELHRLRGELLGQQGTQDQAEESLGRALAIARHQQAKALELRAAISLGRFWLRQGKRAAARDLLAELYAWFTEGFDIADLQEAQALLSELT
jgi:predicted ATPase